MTNGRSRVNWYARFSFRANNYGMIREFRIRTAMEKHETSQYCKKSHFLSQFLSFGQKKFEPRKKTILFDICWQSKEIEWSGGERKGTGSEHLAAPALVRVFASIGIVLFSRVSEALNRHNRKFSVSDGSEISPSSTAIGPTFSDVLSDDSISLSV